MHQRISFSLGAFDSRFLSLFRRPWLLRTANGFSFLVILSIVPLPFTGRFGDTFHTTTTDIVVISRHNRRASKMQRGTSHRKKDKSSRSTTPERPRNRTYAVTMPLLRVRLTIPLNCRAASSKDTKKVRHSDNDPAPSLVSGTQIPRGNVSIGTSIRGTDPGRKKQLPSSDVADVLFRIKMCITQWKLMNKKIEIALQKRKKKVRRR